jgi:hypothetical protein
MSSANASAYPAAYPEVVFGDDDATRRIAQTALLKEAETGLATERAVKFCPMAAP